MPEEDYYSNGYNDAQETIANSVLKVIRDQDKNSAFKTAWVEGYMQSIIDHIEAE